LTNEEHQDGKRSASEQQRKEEAKAIQAAWRSSAAVWFNQA
jgi:hypothetical protein